MKKAIKLFGTIALAALVMFSFAACGGGNGDNGGGGGGGGGDPNQKKITITGIPSVSANNAYNVWIFDGDGKRVAFNVTSERTASSVTLPLGWNGSGKYKIGFSISNPPNYELYYYTDGKSFTDLGISGDPSKSSEKLPDYNITSQTSVIPLSKFAKWL